MHCKKKKYIFMHNPKCAGTFIKHFILSNTKEDYQQNTDLKKYQDEHDVFGELKIESIISKHNINHADFESFTVIRNPWDRVVSMFNFLGGWKYDYIMKNKKEVHLLDKVKIFHKFYKDEDFEKFIEYCFLAQNIRSFHQGYIENIIDRSSINDKVVIKNFYKQEKIFNTMIEISKLIKFDVKHVHKDWRMNSSRKFSLKKQYRDYYNDNSKKIISKVFEKDIDAFKYTF